MGMKGIGRVEMGWDEYERPCVSEGVLEVT